MPDLIRHKARIEITGFRFSFEWRKMDFLIFYGATICGTVNLIMSTPIICIAEFVLKNQICRKWVNLSCLVPESVRWIRGAHSAPLLTGLYWFGIAYTLHLLLSVAWQYGLCVGFRQHWTRSDSDGKFAGRRACQIRIVGQYILICK